MPLIRSYYSNPIKAFLASSPEEVIGKLAVSNEFSLEQAERLKPHAIDVKSPMDPIHWFLDGKEDVRSSFYLEDVATEFAIQGLELDWVCVTWDADFRHTANGWDHRSFVGSKWNKINKAKRKVYLKNA